MAARVCRQSYKRQLMDTRMIELAFRISREAGQVGLQEGTNCYTQLKVVDQVPYILTESDSASVPGPGRLCCTQTGVVRNLHRELGPFRVEVDSEITRDYQ